jgi:hypothetical protein
LPPPKLTLDPKPISRRAWDNKSELSLISNTGALSEIFGIFHGWNIVP